MDQAVVTYARANHPEWLSAGGSTWADGYVILVVSPADHMVGTYVGEDVALSRSAQKDVQDAAKDDFRNGRWSEGIVAAVNKAAALIPGENTQRQGNIVPSRGRSPNSGMTWRSVTSGSRVPLPHSSPKGTTSVA